MEEKDQPLDPSNNRSKKLFVRKKEDIRAKLKLLNEPELFLTEKGSDQYLERLALKIQLHSGHELVFEHCISEKRAEYHPKFFKELFYEIARLNGLDNSVMDVYHKPQCVPDFINQFIYGRFPMKVLRYLRAKAPWTNIPGVRACKLFQHLSDSADKDLDSVIMQAYLMAKDSQKITDFKVNYSKRYRVYFQLDMFTDIAINP